MHKVLMNPLFRISHMRLQAYQVFCRLVKPLEYEMFDQNSGKIKTNITTCPPSLFQHFSFLPASIPLPLSRDDSVEVANQKRLLRTLEQLTNRLKRTLSKQQHLSTFHVSSEMIVADPKSLESKKASLYCKPGSVLKGRMCGEFTLKRVFYLLLFQVVLHLW